MTSLLSGPSVTAPRHLTRPPSVSSAGQEVIELAASAGLILDAWQQHDLTVMLAERSDYKWAARTTIEIVPRQNGKGSEIEALELGALYLFGEELILHSAHEFKTSSEAFLRIKALIDNTDDLRKRVRRMHSSHGSEGVELLTGQRLRFVARSKSSGRGFSADRLILDEAFNLHMQMLSAMVPTMGTRPNPQTNIFSSAPIPDPCSDVLRDLIKRGREGVEGMALIEYSADPDCDLDDRSAWASGNPSYPHRLTEEAVQGERSLMSDEAFALERLGIWSEDDLSAQVIPAERWAAAEHQDSHLSGRQMFGLAVAEDRSWAAVAAAGASDVYDGCHVEIAAYKPGVRWVIQRAVELKAAWGGKFGIVKGSPASSLIPDLLTAGLLEDDIVEISAEENAKHCGQLFDAVMESRFVHRGEGELNKSVQGATSRPYGDAWVWSQRKSAVDISPLVAVTSAAGLHGLGIKPMALPEAIRL